LTITIILKPFLKPSHYPRSMSIPKPIFCCGAPVPVSTSNSNKPHNDPNRELHHALYRSFLAFAERRQRAAALRALILGVDTEPTLPPPTNTLPTSQQQIPTPVLTREALENNPITPKTLYVIHLTARQDFGPVLSHRYFVCPLNLQHDWIEASLEQWFATGEQFKFTAEKWDLKCITDSRFYRLTLRPNLAMRASPLTVGNT
jgi:hypothetical protein